MRVDFDAFKKACPTVDEGFLKEHLSRLPPAYFSRFAKEELYHHAKGLFRISSKNPVELDVKQKRDSTVECTVLAFNYPTVLSIITGVLTGMGVNILSGDVYTYHGTHVTIGGHKGRAKKPRSTRGENHLKRRRIIDHFEGTRHSSLPFRDWKETLKQQINAVFALLEKGGEASVNEAQSRIHEMVAQQLSQIQRSASPVLYPVQISVEAGHPSLTRLRVVSEDTPAFLYALSNALSLKGLVIERVRIRTIQNRIEDQIDILDRSGQKITDADALDQIKLSVLLTKQFTYFLGQAPDPSAALDRFEQLVMEIQNKPLQGQWLELLTNPNTLRDLARLLGTSEYLWEDFIRLQYETLLPILHPSGEGSPFSLSPETIGKRLDKALEGAQSLKEKKVRLNQFKDQEIFLIDLDHILNAKVGFRSLSEKLTILAEEVIQRAARIVFDSLVSRYGRPRTVAGLDARYAILGLGKLGGAALGYASDLEIIFVYSDNGRTDGSQSIQNSEFFDRLVKDFNRFISAKREGIFHLDLRLRPYGQAAPLASSLEGFCRYYGQGGKAHAYERLSLVRMRAIAGDRELGSQLERLRDDMVYASGLINIGDLQELRLRQFQEKAKGNRPNAKFSPGALVDLEYGVQILQVIYGRKAVSLRSPRIHTALSSLTEIGVLDPGECARLGDAYEFLRNLINGMRMLRGHAKDLFLPHPDSKEYEHLARRMGYGGRSPLAPGVQLYIDFERHTAAVRLFTERHFGRESIPGLGVGTVADLVLSDKVPEELRERILTEARFNDPVRAYVNLKALAGHGSQRDTFVKLALLASDVLGRTPDPDMALNNWERFIGRRVSPEFHYQTLLSQPMRLEILLGLFSGSQFLADTLIRNPGFLDWVMIPELLHHLRKREDIEDELRRAAEGHGSSKGWLNDLRRLRRREVLRIGTRDLCLKVPTQDVVYELSVLAEACIQVTYERALRNLKEEAKGEADLFQGKRFCIMALGKLGGKELNYSSDIDLLALWDDRSLSLKDDGIPRQKIKGFYARLMERIRSDLSQHTEEGYAFRVDLRLRPFGRAGELVPSFSSVVEYYRRDASLWEIQAALKMRPIAGNLQTGFSLLERLRPELLKRRDRASIVAAIDRMRSTAIKSYSETGRPFLDVKSGLGGLRDVEFLVQGLQLIHSHGAPHLLECNTLLALGALSEEGILPVKVAETLMEDYLFLRKVEHYLQILEDQQIHSLPKGKEALSALAKRVHGVEGKGSLFMDEVRQCLRRIRENYSRYLIKGAQTG